MCPNAKEKENVRTIEKMRSGAEDEFQPLSVLDPDGVSDFDELLSAMSKTAFGGRNLGEALDVLETMVTDPECLVVATFSGAMTVAKMGGLICKMIDNGWINVVISTGALMAHGLVESIGLKHYKYKNDVMDDNALFEAGYNRVYDTLEPESNLCQADEVINNALSQMKNEAFLSSERICSIVGKYLAEHFREPGILKSAYEKNVPVYIPAFTDSEFALDVACFLLRNRGEIFDQDFDPSLLPFHFNPFLDLVSYTKRIVNAKRIGIFTIGGGVPRNWAQQVAPFLEILRFRQVKELPMRRFNYGVRICPEPDHWGGLSGCTYQEGVSWGKFVSPREGGKFAEVFCDATIAWPILVKGLQNRMAKKALI
jgi:deoxyhypusine synthase